MTIRAPNLSRLVGKRIVKANLNPFKDGRGGTAHDPNFVLEDGTLIRFYVEETDVGEYGVCPVIVKPSQRSG